MVVKVIVLLVLLSVVTAHPAVSSQHVHRYDSPHGSERGHGHGHRSGHGQGFGQVHSEEYSLGYGDEQRHANGNWQGRGHRSGHGHNEHEYHAHPKYEFEYNVHDSDTGDHKSQHESRDGDIVHGFYRLEQPDGSVRDVHYHGDDQSGFHADVKYSTHHGTPEHQNNYY